MPRVTPAPWPAELARSRFLCTLALIGAGLLGTFATDSTYARPSIVLIVLDDVGFGDTSTFGGAAETPNLTRLAAQGLRYNNFHTAALCSPTRAALLSGRNHHRMGFGTVGERDLPGYDGLWKPEMASVAQVLRLSGYSTAAFGKWHNTPSWEITPVGPFDRWPTGLGFEYFYGNMIGMSSQWEPALWRNTTAVLPPRSAAQGYHLTSDLTDEAIAWLHTQRALAATKPYFLYFAPGAAHTPHHVPKAWIEKYRGRFHAGWDAERNAIFSRQKRLGVIPAEATLTPRPAEIPAWDSLSPQQKTLYARQMEIYAAFIAHTDHEVGRLLQAVNADPRSEDTVVLYLVGDNGPEGAIGMEGAENIVATAMGRAQSLADQIHHMDELGGPLHTNIYSAGWAWMGSTPFKWMKHVGSHLGGVRNPLIVSWPARIRDQGGLRSGFAHVTDVVPTLYDIAGLVPPSNVNGVVQSSFDGVSFAASFGSPTAEPGHRVQYFEIQGNRAIYSDGWMAAARHTVPWIERPWAVPPLTTDQRWELYHLGTDFTQSRDLAERDPVRLASMRALFDQQALVNRVQPIGISVGTVRRSPVEGQKRFIYDGDFPGVSLGARVTPDLTRPYRLTAAIELKTMDSQGVLFAAGGRGSGVVLHVREQHLVFESNYLGQSRDALVSTERLPLGRSRITLDFSAPQDDEGQRTVQLYIEDRPAGEVRLRKFSTPDPLDNFDIGQDSGEPVGAQYEPPHRFTGVVESLTIELH